MAATPVAAKNSGSTEARPVFKTERGTIHVETIAAELDHPWGMAFLPDGSALVTERPGRMRLLGTDGRFSQPLSGLPKVDVVGQGGLLDVAIDSEFNSNRLVYVSYAEPRGDGTSATAVARGKLTDRGLEDVRVIFQQQPVMKSEYHFGSRLVFARDGTLFVTMGDRNFGREKVQDLGTDIGKIVRIDRDGKPPADNPYLKTPGARPELWSVGHRNVQGAALHPQTGELWADEHGPKGGDELNRVLGGRNYGWPVVTYGREYSGAVVSDRKEAPGYESPVHYWVPSIGTSGLMFYTGDLFPMWRGNAFVGGLAAMEISRLELDGNRVVHEERLLGALKKRIRTIKQAPDGSIFILTDENPGQLLRLAPAESNNQRDD